jgi:hypothetical protein
MKMRIAGILCEIESDELGFVNIFIADGQKLYPEWIIRGGLNEAAAVVQARWVIKERLDGRTIVHDCEGRIFSISDPTRGGSSSAKGEPFSL